MSAIELAIEKVKKMDEVRVRQLLNWLQEAENPVAMTGQPAGAMAMLGFARRFRSASRSTSEWMDELRAGERG